MSVEFTDNSVKVIAAIGDAVSAFMHEAGGELQAQTMRNSRVDIGQTKGSYECKVSESMLAGQSECTVGSNYENAIWEEFGTGEYALHGDGRKGGWTYRDENGVYHHTNGKTPNRPLYNSFNTLREPLKNRLSTVMKDLG